MLFYTFYTLYFLSHVILMQSFFQNPLFLPSIRAHWSISTHPAFTSNALTFKPCLLQTTRKEFAEDWLKDTYCATNKEGWNTIKILTYALKCHEIQNHGSALHPQLHNCTEALPTLPCDRRLPAAAEPHRHFGPLQLFAQAPDGFPGSWSPLRLQKKALS